MGDGEKLSSDCTFGGNGSFTRTPFRRMILAGTPATTQFAGTSFVTTALAPTVTLLPIVIGPRIFAPALTLTLSPRMGPRVRSVQPITTSWLTLQFLPML